MIAIIDSGSGGINVINECKKYYNEDFIYLVDNKNCPYGNKPFEQVQKIVTQNILYLINNFDLDLIIIGCNTASAILSYLQTEQIKVPILKTKPDLESLIKSKGTKCIFATKNTIKKSNYVQYYLLNYNQIKTLYIKDLPKHIDAKIALNLPQNAQKIKKILKKHAFIKKYCQNMALGCTHFKHIKFEIKDVFGENITFFECEKQVAKISKYLIRKSKNKTTIKVLLTKQDANLQNQLTKMLL